MLLGVGARELLRWAPHLREGLLNSSWTLMLGDETHRGEMTSPPTERSEVGREDNGGQGVLRSIGRSSSSWRWSPSIVTSIWLINQVPDLRLQGPCLGLNTYQTYTIRRHVQHTLPRYYLYIHFIKLLWTLPECNQ